MLFLRQEELLRPPCSKLQELLQQVQPENASEDYQTPGNAEQGKATLHHTRFSPLMTSVPIFSSRTRALIHPPWNSQSQNYPNFLNTSAPCSAPANFLKCELDNLELLSPDWTFSRNEPVLLDPPKCWDKTCDPEDIFHALLVASWSNDSEHFQVLRNGNTLLKLIQGKMPSPLRFTRHILPRP